MRYLLPSSLVICLLSSVLLADDRPNILWLTCEDISPNLGCYGDHLAVTPQLDQLAKQGVRLRAINALDRIGEHALPVIELMQQATMPKGTIFPADYLNRMCEYLHVRSLTPTKE